MSGPGGGCLELITNCQRGANAKNLVGRLPVTTDREGGIAVRSRDELVMAVRGACLEFTI